MLEVAECSTGGSQVVCGDLKRDLPTQGFPIQFLREALY